MKRRTPKVALVVVLAVAVLGVTAWLHRDQVPFLHGGGRAAAVQRSPYVRPPVDVHPDDPFWGTAAATFPSGEQGLVAPAATASGDWSAAAVTSALDQVRTALITGHLDQRITVQGRFDPLVGVFAPDNQTKLRKAIAAKQDFGLLVRIAPGSTPAAVPPRVKGDTTVSTTVEHGPQGATRTVLEVTTNYVWVYPFAGRTTRPGDHLVVSHERSTWTFYHPADVVDHSAAVRFQSGTGYRYSMDCAADENDELKPATPLDPSRRPDASPSDPPDAYFQPDHPLDIGRDCN